ncbi:MAG: hypothetical protein ACI90V_002491 [Bacillariaceae sp.]|jgi:hypothetical protein
MRAMKFIIITSSVSIYRWVFHFFFIGLSRNAITYVPSTKINTLFWYLSCV